MDVLSKTAPSTTAVESRARRAAKKVGLTARKSRWRIDTIDNLGGFQLVDTFANVILSGEKFDLTAEKVIEFCRQRM